jgi:hypothetical protein
MIRYQRVVKKGTERKERMQSKRATNQRQQKRSLLKERMNFLISSLMRIDMLYICSTLQMLG